jgi:hypothetical protein
MYLAKDIANSIFFPLHLKKDARNIFSVCRWQKENRSNSFFLTKKIGKILLFLEARVEKKKSWESRTGSNAPSGTQQAGPFCAVQNPKKDKNGNCESAFSVDSYCFFLLFFKFLFLIESHRCCHKYKF